MNSGQPPWGASKFGDIAEFSSGKNADYTNTDEFEVFGANGVIATHKETNFDGGIVIGRVGAAGEVNRTEGAVWVSDNGIKVENIDENEEYLFQMLMQIRPSNLANQAVQPIITQSILNHIDIPVPPRTEQERIASVLYVVDQMIDTTQQLLNKHERVKDALLSELFSVGLDGESLRTIEGLTSLEETSLGKKLPKSWEWAYLSDITHSSLYGLNESGIKYQEHLPRYIRITDITADGRLRPDGAKSVDIDGLGDRELQEGDILFARSGATAGKAYLYQNSNGICTYGGYLIRYQIDDSQIHPKFLQQYTQSPQYMNWTRRVSRGGAQDNISAKQYDRLAVPIPPRDEQERIADTLDMVDARKTVWIDRKTRLESVKAGLMQDLLSGEVRTPDSLEPLDDVVSQ